MVWSLVFFFLLGLALPIIFFGVTRIISFIRPSGSEQTLISSPVYLPVPTERCENTMMRIENLRTELNDVTKKLKLNQLPDPNYWTNYALQSHGAKVYKKQSSKTYEKIEGFKIFGIQLFSKVGPASVIQGQHPPIPGNCWSFPGSHGNLFIELSHTVTVSHVTLDHVSSSVVPADTISSAPRQFSVYGRQRLDDRAVHLGKFTYDLEGNPTQTFAVKVYDTMAFKYIDLQIDSNYGHADYTCLYGFRVHGL
ncbi:unnamed protein product [Tetraodon nigroviridis]|uniref:(spotted green pufferfish) hypothetical protein n=1 Tax=Tetraodon nigroviridis TaxID=99883 RepID=Q4THL6_TETNG|nr:unnamed protein product [Tetraodon nigroviridis]